MSDEKKPESAAAPARATKKFLLCIDFSKHSTQVVSTFMRIATPEDYAVLTVVTAPIQYDVPDAAEQERKSQAEAKEKLAPYIAQLHDGGFSNFDLVIHSGDPRQTIFDVVAKRTVDFVVMGSRGHSGLKGALLGSTSQFIIQNCSCSVILARHGAAEK